MTLYAISGSQGSGKTTVLNELKLQGFNIIERKTARSRLKELNKTLEEVYADTELFIKFQEDLIDMKINDEANALKSDEIWFTERSFADLFTYALILIGYNNDYDDWIRKYYSKCQNNQKYYTKVFYMPQLLSKIEEDGIRSVNSMFSRLVDVGMYDISRQMTNINKLKAMSYLKLENRVEFIINNIEK